VQALRERGAAAVIECGPGKVLAGMVKRIDAEAVSASIADPATLAEARALVA
jgi:[acyl-carrier-protein] S-malonyltransferase